MGAGGATAGVAASGESIFLGQEVAAAVGGGGWVRHGVELEGLDTLWEIVLNATGERERGERTNACDDARPGLGLCVARARRLRQNKGQGVHACGSIRHRS